MADETIIERAMHILPVRRPRKKSAPSSATTRKKQVADILDISQSALSQREGADILITTLISYLDALDCTLQLAITTPSKEQFLLKVAVTKPTRARKQRQPTAPVLGAAGTE